MTMMKIWMMIFQKMRVLRRKKRSQKNFAAISRHATHSVAALTRPRFDAHSDSDQLPETRASERSNCNQAGRGINTLRFQQAFVSKGITEEIKTFVSAGGEVMGLISLISNWQPMNFAPRIISVARTQANRAVS